MRVWVTRDEQPDGPLSTALRAAGLTVVHEPVLTRSIVDDAAEAISRLGPDDWLVLTSVYAVEVVPCEPARVPRVAVVSDTSRDAAVARGFRVELVSSGGGAMALFGELRSKVTAGKICYPRSSLARPPDPWPGVELISPVLYETNARDFDTSVIDRVDVATVASPSAVNAIRAAGFSPREFSPLDGLRTAVDPVHQNENRFSPRELRFASIGPTTTGALRRIGLDPWIEAPKRTFESLAQAIAAQPSDSNHQRA